MINSIGHIDYGTGFPTFTGIRIYMQETSANKYKEHLPDQYHDTVHNMLKSAPNLDWDARIFITIDEKHLTPNKQHRRGGVHVDGNFIFDWGGGGGGGGWLNGVAGRELSPENHKLQYGSDKGGLIMASTYAACQVWLGQVEGEPGQGGSCEHLREALEVCESFLIPSNAIMVANSQMIHEGLAVKEEVDRQLVRITLNPEYSLV